LKLRTHNTRLANLNTANYYFDSTDCRLTKTMIEDKLAQRTRRRVLLHARLAPARD